MKKAKKKPTGDYDVGYCRAPNASKYKKGQSGNLLGRPVKIPNLDDLIFQQAMQKIRVVENGVEKWITVEQGIVMNLMRLALKGDVKAYQIVMQAIEGVRKRKRASVTKVRPEFEREALMKLSLDELAKLSLDGIAAEDYAHKRRREESE